MKKLTINSNPNVKEKFKKYPPQARKKLSFLRKLILETAAEIDHISEVEESLKWNEPSYSVKKGSPIRINWKEKSPDEYGIYFSCSTRLVPTFRLIYKDQFEFEGKRAILFGLEDEIPVEALKYCISLALTYHQVKHLPMLGA